MFDSVNAFAIYILIPDVTLKNAECKDCNLKKIKTHITWYKSNQKVLGLVVAWHLGVLIPEKRLYVSHIKHINKLQLISVRFHIEKFILDSTWNNMSYIL